METEKGLLLGIIYSQEWFQLLFFGFIVFAIATVVRLMLSRKRRKLAKASVQPGV